MNERKNQQTFPIDGRILGGILLLLMGSCGVMWAQEFQSVPEISTPNELTGDGYRITRSQLGHNLLKIEGLNKFPAAVPLDGAQKGRDRIARICGPIISFEDVGRQPDGDLIRAFYAEVPDVNKCFPQVASN
ncbi:MAG: hypothetical protein Q7R49_06835 [Candidatus Daviesbacteria bacterium]|nr:hypothetical protein [Candidatus Daviesbacteria bacterium]